MAERKGKLFLVLGPSGAGKGVVMAHLRGVLRDAFFPVSCTTRSPRPGEKDGEVYNFITREKFEKKIANGDFLEYAIVHHDNYYGTLKKPIMDALNAGKTVIREVDMQGVESICRLLSKDQVVSIFLTVPSWEVLKDRILRRQQESREELSQRETSFEKEMQFSKKCDYIVQSIEGKQDQLCDDVAKIIIGWNGEDC